MPDLDGLLAVAVIVQGLRVGRALEDANPGLLSDERVGRDAEGLRDERPGRVADDGHVGGLGLGVVLDGPPGHLAGVGEVVRHGVGQFLQPHARLGRREQHRDHRARNHRLGERGGQFLRRDFLAAQVGLHQGLVGLDDALDQLRVGVAHVLDVRLAAGVLEAVHHRRVSAVRAGSWPCRRRRTPRGFAQQPL